MIFHVSNEWWFRNPDTGCKLWKSNEKIPITCISNRLPKASGSPGPLGSPWTGQNMQWRDLFMETELWIHLSRDWMLLRAASKRLGTFAADWMLSEDCKNIQKDKSCDLCNCQFPKARMHVVLILLYFCDISVYFCKAAPETNSLPHLSWTVWNRTASASCKDRSA